MKRNRVESSDRWTRIGFWIMAALAIIFYSSLHFIQIGSQGYTNDEKLDVYIANCYAQERDWAACPKDLSQTRLPYYIHAFSEVWTGDNSLELDYKISFVFGLATLIVMTVFTYKIFGPRHATILLMLLSTSFPLLTSSRMVLTNSNIIFAFFASLTIIASYYFIQKPNRKRTILLAMLFGVTVGTQILGVFLGLFILAYYFFSRVKFQPFHLLFIPISIIAFFAASPFYLVEFRWMDLIIHLTTFSWDPLWWNYFGMGHNPPWWYSFLLFFVKMTPWFALIFFITPFLLRPKYEPARSKAIFLYSLFASSVVYMLIKPTAFNYDAPHHHIHVYLWAYVLIAYTLIALYDRLKNNFQRNLAILLLPIIFGIQFYHIGRFFPHLSFYGAQYGERFIGDIYGPAVFAFQGVEKADAEFNKIFWDKDRIFFLTGSVFHRDTGVFFADWDGELNVRYAFDTFYYHHHLHPFKYEEYQKFLAENCEKIWTYMLPYGYEGYAIYDCQ